jgi:putative hydrolase of the HAD superfamily
MRTEAVLFDYGLTLVTFEYPTTALVEVLETVRPWLGPEPPTAEWLLFHVLHPLEQDLDGFGSEDEIDYLDFYRRAWRRAGLTLSDDVLYRILDLEQRAWDRSVRLVPGALDVIDRLRARGLLTGICSNAPFPPEMMQRQLRATGLAERMDAIVFSSAVGRRKPSPEPYRAALAALGIPAERVLFIGDRVREDYEGPLAVGMRAAIVCPPFGPPPAAGVASIATLAGLESLL